MNEEKLSVCRAAYYYFKNRHSLSIRQCLSTLLTQEAIVILNFVTSRINDYNFLLYDISDYNNNQLQSVQSTPPSIVTNINKIL